MLIFALGERGPASRSHVSAWDLKRTFLKQGGAGPCHACGVDRRGISVMHAGADAGRSAMG